MKKLYEKYSGWVMLVCIIIIFILSIKNYVDKGEQMYTQLCIVFALIPATIQAFKPELKGSKKFKYFNSLMATLAVAMLIAAGITTM